MPNKFYRQRLVFPIDILAFPRASPMEIVPLGDIIRFSHILPADFHYPLFPKTLVTMF